jgi:hypothetical protein
MRQTRLSRWRRATRIDFGLAEGLGKLSTVLLKVAANVGDTLVLQARCLVVSGDCGRSNRPIDYFATSRARGHYA